MYIYVSSYIPHEFRGFLEGVKQNLHITTTFFSGLPGNLPYNAKIKTKITNVEQAAEFFLKKIHVDELYGDIQLAVHQYRINHETTSFDDAKGFLVDIYKDDLEHWINENQVLNLHLRQR